MNCGNLIRWCFTELIVSSTFVSTYASDVGGCWLLERARVRVTRFNILVSLFLGKYPKWTIWPFSLSILWSNIVNISIKTQEVRKSLSLRLARVLIACFQSQCSEDNRLFIIRLSNPQKLELFLNMWRPLRVQSQRYRNWEIRFSQIISSQSDDRFSIGSGGLKRRDTGKKRENTEQIQRTQIENSL
jgi:hypothetical protein